MATIEPLSTTKTAKPIERSDFALRVQYKNNLPDIPFDTKFIPYTFDTKKFCNYQTTSLEKQFAYELYCEDDLGVNINLIDIDKYKITDVESPLDPIDELLVNDDTTIIDNSNIKRSKPVSWLRRTSFTPISRSSSKTNSIIETTIGAGIAPEIIAKNRFQTREEQITAINQSFIDAKQEVTTHHSNKELKPVEVHPILPDDELWKYTFSHITFDSNPTIQGKGDAIKEELCQNAILKGMSDNIGEYVGYFIKNPDINSFNTDTHLFEMVREYSWQIQNISSALSPEDIYFLRFHPNKTVTYNEVSARVRLNKRRLTGGQLKNNTCSTLLTVIPRTETDDELDEQNKRCKIFTPQVKASTQETTFTNNHLSVNSKTDKSSQQEENVDFEELLNDFKLEDSSEL